ncbi:hypothetical protein [Bacillus timonensis]|uniref:hypothetical protein n=1 Tax=Bacillus timonensis TaxID=1033734 RepID=UPI00028A40FD|nr:hypothetical protein [Bacillus timonensis]
MIAGVTIIFVVIIAAAFITFIESSNFMKDDWTGEPPDIKLVFEEEQIIMMHSNLSWARSDGSESKSENHPVEAATNHSNHKKLPRESKLKIVVIDHENKLDNAILSAFLWENEKKNEELEIRNEYLLLPNKVGTFTLAIQLKDESGYVESVTTIELY